MSSWFQIALTAAPRAAVTGVGQGGTSSAVALLGWPVGAGEVRGAVRFTQVTHFFCFLFIANVRGFPFFIHRKSFHGLFFISLI